VSRQAFRPAGKEQGLTMLSSIFRTMSVNGVRRHVRVAQRALDFAMLAAKHAYQGGRYSSLELAVWDTLECRPGWVRSGPDSWRYSNGDIVDRHEGELIASVFLSMLIIELGVKIARTRWREDLFEALIDEWRKQQLAVGVADEHVEAIVGANAYVAFIRSRANR
jgi:hypothetical protein